MPKRNVGDYYIRFCDWCDSHNATMRTRVDGLMRCSACQQLAETGMYGGSSGGHINSGV